MPNSKFKQATFLGLWRCITLAQIMPPIARTKIGCFPNDTGFYGG